MYLPAPSGVARPVLLLQLGVDALVPREGAVAVCVGVEVSQLAVSLILDHA